MGCTPEAVSSWAVAEGPRRAKTTIRIAVVASEYRTASPPSRSLAGVLRAPWRVRRFGSASKIPNTAAVHRWGRCGGCGRRDGQRAVRPASDGSIFDCFCNHLKSGREVNAWLFVDASSCEPGPQQPGDEVPPLWHEGCFMLQGISVCSARAVVRRTPTAPRHSPRRLPGGSVLRSRRVLEERRFLFHMPPHRGGGNLENREVI